MNGKDFFELIKKIVKKETYFKWPERVVNTKKITSELDLRLAGDSPLEEGVEINKGEKGCATIITIPTQNHKRITVELDGTNYNHIVIQANDFLDIIHFSSEDINEKITIMYAYDQGSKRFILEKELKGKGTSTSHLGVLEKTEEMLSFDKIEGASTSIKKLTTGKSFEMVYSFHTFYIEGDDHKQLFERNFDYCTHNNLGEKIRGLTQWDDISYYLTSFFEIPVVGQNLAYIYNSQELNGYIEESFQNMLPGLPYDIAINSPQHISRCKALAGFTTSARISSITKPIYFFTRCLAPQYYIPRANMPSTVKETNDLGRALIAKIHKK